VSIGSYQLADATDMRKKGLAGLWTVARPFLLLADLTCSCLAAHACHKTVTPTWS